jgi:hypothetical protein
MTQTTTATKTVATETTIPFVGQGAAIHGYTDVHSATVVAVSANGKRVTLQRDKAKLLNGASSGEADALEFYPGGFCGHTSGCQRWELTPDADGYKSEFSLRSNGRWVEVGQPAKGGTRASVGERRHHYDFNF